MRRKSRIRAIVLFPLASVLFIIGWVLVHFGEKKVAHAHAKPVANKDTSGIEIGMLSVKEHQVTA
jgi:hypothetical protein